MALSLVLLAFAVHAEIDSYTDCVEAGYDIMKSNPPQCSTPDGRTFTESTDDADETGSYQGNDTTSDDGIVVTTDSAENSSPGQKKRDMKQQVKQEIKEIRNDTKNEIKLLRSDYKNQSENLTDEEKEQLKEETKEAIRALKEDVKNNFTQKREELKTFLKQRNITKERMEDFKEKYEDAREQFKEALKNSSNEKKQFADEKREYQSCLKENGTTSAQCQEMESALLNRSQTYLLATVDSLILHLQKVKDKLESSDAITDAELQTALSEIDALLQQLEEMKTNIAEAQTKEDIRTIAQELKNLLHGVDVKTKVYALRLMNGEVGKILARSQALEDKMDRLLTSLEQQGENVTIYDEKLAAYQSLIDEARDLWDQAVAKYVEAKALNNGQAKNALEEAKSLAKQAHQKLKDAQQLYVDLVKELRKKNISTEALTGEAQ